MGTEVDELLKQKLGLALRDRGNAVVDVGLALEIPTLAVRPAPTGDTKVFLPRGGGNTRLKHAAYSPACLLSTESSSLVTKRELASPFDSQAWE